jgi:DNA invertase Pin-like site-specific DNA recombinase
MLPNEKDKENVVIDLLKKGHKTREISKMAHVSNTTIKKIGAKLTGEVNEEKDDPKKKTLSVRHSSFFWRASPLSRLPLGLTCLQTRP